MGKNLYRSGLKSPLDDKALEFLSSLNEDLWIVEEDIIGTEVHDIMLFEQKVLNRDEIRKILIALGNLKEQIAKKKIEVNEDFEDIHPFIENSVIKKIGVEIGGKVHTGRSRNDQIAVDLRLKIRKELNKISNEMFAFFEVLINLSKENIDSFIPLYTHLQRGQLGVFSHYLNNYLAQILRSLERIEEIYRRVNKNPLGACAIGGTSININRYRTSELLGFDGLIYNSIDAISSRDYIYETLMALSVMAIQFSRIAEDLILWTTKEFNFIELDDKYCSVSSVMPQKKNPDTIELIRSRSSKIISNLFGSALITKGIPTGYFRDFQDLKILLKNSFEQIHSITDMFNGIFSTLKVNKENMKRVVNESFTRALDLAEVLVQEYSIPFRQSHNMVAQLVQSSIKPEDIFNKDKIESLIFKILNKKITISDDLLHTLTNLDLCLEKRVSQGSPASAEIQNYIEELNNNRKALYKLYLKRTEKIEKSKALREKIISELQS